MLNAVTNTVPAAVAILVGLIGPASAGACSVPAPIVGAGLPVLLIAAGAYWAVKTIRSRRKH